MLLQRHLAPLGTTISHVLVLAGVEFIYFTAAGRETCLGFVLKSAHRDVFTIFKQGLHFFASHPTSEEAGNAQEVGRNTARKGDFKRPKGYIPDHLESCSVHKAGRRRKEEHSQES